ncbi:MAG: MogA/MoaB family molybdenum cofactor biosynthesis protein [Deltaproteobacteria bacterium]|nr:MogA/MoaB family molybdenum cofactor biosynthesis protein [Deltaproteobacteria bacterium]MBW2205389.1 MogA/MoaB family molybdenum cofactor biosynthesis protein [Deltaproteobacteria bacterium]
MEVDLRVGVLTLSDKASRGQREDGSGTLAVTILKADGFSVAKQKIVPDDALQIIDTLRNWVDRDRLPLIITSGGTGLSPSDVTPQAMKEIIDYEVPGIAEAMRAESLQKTPHAMLSRAMAGVRKCSLIINLPGSPGGVKDNLTLVLPALKHALAKLQGDASDCAIR